MPNYTHPLYNLFNSFSLLTEAEISHILSHFKPKSHKTGTILVNFGEINDKLYFVEKGLLREFSEQEQIINNNLATVIAKGISPNLRVSSSPLKWFGLEYAYKLSSFKNIIADIPKQSIIQQNHDVKLNFNPAEKWYLGVNTEVYINNFNNIQNLFSDLIFRRTIGKKKIDLEATWLNIFNTKSLLSLSNGAFNYVETAYILRPSQIITKIRFPLQQLIIGWFSRWWCISLGRITITSTFTRCINTIT